MNPIGFAINAVLWIFSATLNTGPWLMQHFYINVVGPLAGRERLLGMGRETTIPISMLFLGAFWGGIWLLFWGTLGAGNLAWWGVAFGVISGWRAGVYIADGLEQARVEVTLEKHDQPTTGSVPEQRIDNRPGQVNLGGFDLSLPPEDQPQFSGRN